MCCIIFQQWMDVYRVHVVLVYRCSKSISFWWISCPPLQELCIFISHLLWRYPACLSIFRLRIFSIFISETRLAFMEDTAYPVFCAYWAPLPGLNQWSLSIYSIGRGLPRKQSLHYGLQKEKYPFHRYLIGPSVAQNSYLPLTSFGFDHFQPLKGSPASESRLGGLAHFAQFTKTQTELCFCCMWSS